MKNYFRVLLLIVFALTMSSVIMAQNSDNADASSSHTKAKVAVALPQDNENPID